MNRAFTSVNLGVGVRVVKGDQTGYGFTEELTPEGLRLAARTAAAIASGPGRPAPQRVPRRGRVPARYTIQTRWEDVRPGEEAAAAAHGEREGAGRRPARAQGAGVLQRRVERRAGGGLDGPDRRGRAADDHHDPHLHRRAGRQARGELLQRRRPRRHQLLLSRAHRAHGARVREEHGRAVRRHARAGRRDAGGAGGRLVGHPAARGHRPRHGGRLQPQERLHLLRQDRQADRQELRQHRRRGHAGARARSHQRRRRGHGGRQDHAGPGRRPHHLPARPHLGEALRRRAHRQRTPAGLPVRARCHACARPTCCPARTRRRRSSPR